MEFLLNLCGLCVDEVGSISPKNDKQELFGSMGFLWIRKCFDLPFLLSALSTSKIGCFFCLNGKNPFRYLLILMLFGEPVD